MTYNLEWRELLKMKLIFRTLIPAIENSL